MGPARGGWVENGGGKIGQQGRKTGNKKPKSVINWKILLEVHQSVWSSSRGVGPPNWPSSEIGKSFETHSCPQVLEGQLVGQMGGLGFGGETVELLSLLSTHTMCRHFWSLSLFQTYTCLPPINIENIILISQVSRVHRWFIHIWWYDAWELGCEPHQMITFCKSSELQINTAASAAGILELHCICCCFKTPNIFFSDQMQEESEMKYWIKYKKIQIRYIWFK